MRFKTTLILAIVFAVLLTVVLFMNKEQTKKEKIEEKAKKLANIEKDNVSELILSFNNIQAKKEDDDWKIISPVETEGDKNAIEGVLGMFSWANIERTISEDTSNLAPFGLDPAKAEMIIIHSAGSDTFYVGDKNATGSFVFARKGHEPRVFLTTTSLKTNAEKTLFDLRNKKVLGFEKNDVRSFLLKNKDGQFTLSKSGSDWKLDEPVNDMADKSKVDNILNGVNNEQAKEFVDENPTNLQKYGLSNPNIIVNMYLGENKAKKSLFIGNQKDKQFYAKDDSRKPVFLVDSSFVNKLNVNLFDLRNKEIAKFTTTDVDSFRLDYSDSLIVCSKDTSGDWLVIEPELRKAKSWKMSSITSAVSNIKVETFVDDNPSNLNKYGLEKPRIKATFYKKGDQLRDILIGTTKGEQVYAKTGDSKSIYLINKDIVETLTPKLDDIAEKKEEPKTDDTSMTEESEE